MSSMGSVLPGFFLAVQIQADTIHCNVPSIPAGFQAVAGYVTGTPDIRWTATDWSRFSTRFKVRINQENRSDPMLGSVFDIQPDAWTNEDAAAACLARQDAGRPSACYTMQGNVTPLVNALVAAGVAQADLWVANWNLSQTQAANIVANRSGPYPIVCVQYASPSSNPGTVLPGSPLCLAEANCDLSIRAAAWSC